MCVWLASSLTVSILPSQFCQFALPTAILQRNLQYWSTIKFANNVWRHNYFVCTVLQCFADFVQNVNRCLIVQVSSDVIINKYIESKDYNFACKSLERTNDLSNLNNSTFLKHLTNFHRICSTNCNYKNGREIFLLWNPISIREIRIFTCLNFLV